MEVLGATEHQSVVGPLLAHDDLTFVHMRLALVHSRHVTTKTLTVPEDAQTLLALVRLVWVVIWGDMLLLWNFDLGYWCSTLWCFSWHPSWSLVLFKWIKARIFFFRLWRNWTWLHLQDRVRRPRGQINWRLLLDFEDLMLKRRDVACFLVLSSKIWKLFLRLVTKIVASDLDICN